VAQAEPSVAGLVVMAGGAEPAHRALLRQVRYLALLDPAAAAASHAAIDALTRQALAAGSADLSPGTPDSELPFGVPASYWLDLRGYDAPAAAADLATPILVLHAGRDYQVTAADLARWQAALGNHPNATIRTYPGDNHLIMPGSGPPSPAEYRQPDQHVDAVVVADITAWLTAQTP
jgi:fermentation-respiration switch protein FrsA (DUF1100 family)